MILLLLETVTIGFPFCAFKIVSGLFFGQHWLLALGTIDLILNTVNFISLLTVKRRLLDACFFTFLVRKFLNPGQERQVKWENFGNSLDVLFSFFLVAYVIGGGFIPHFSQDFLAIWNTSVILNVVGAGSSRMSDSISKLKDLN